MVLKNLDAHKCHNCEFCLGTQFLNPGLILTLILNYYNIQKRLFKMFSWHVMISDLVINYITFELNYPLDYFHKEKGFFQVQCSFADSQLGPGS